MAGPPYLPPLPERTRSPWQLRFSLSRLLIVFVLVGPLLVAARHVMGREDFWQLAALVSCVAFGAALIMFTAGFAWRMPLDVLAFCTSASAFLWLGTIVVGWRAIGIVQHAMDTLISPHANRNEFGMDVGVLLALGAGGCVVAGCVIGLVIALTEEHQR